MFGIGMPELVLILAVALIILGPKRLPEIARSLGRAMGEFKKATNELKSAVNLDDDISDIKHTINDVKEDVWNIAELNIDKAPPEEQGTDDSTQADNSVSEDGSPAGDRQSDGEDKNE